MKRYGDISSYGRNRAVSLSVLSAAAKSTGTGYGAYMGAHVGRAVGGAAGAAVGAVAGGVVGAGRHVLRSKKLGPNPSLVMDVALSGVKGADIGATTVGIPAALAVGAVGAYVGVVWDITKIIVGLMSGGKNLVVKGQSQVTRVAFLVNQFKSYDEKGILHTEHAQDQIKKDFIKNFAKIKSITSPDQRIGQESKWLHDWYDFSLNQYINLRDSAAKAAYRDMEFKRKSAEMLGKPLPPEPAHPPSGTGSKRKLRSKNVYGPNRPNQPDPLDQLLNQPHQLHSKGLEDMLANIRTDINSKNEDVALSAEKADTLNEQFVLLIEAQSKGRDRMREWIIDQLQNSDIPHDVLKKAFLAKFGKSKGLYFDKIVNQFFEM